MIRPIDLSRTARNVAMLGAGIAGVLFAATNAAFPSRAQDAAPQFHGALLSAEAVTPKRLHKLKAAGVNAIALPIHDAPSARAAESRASERIHESGLRLGFWIEVARAPELAEAHPAWMASLQGHTEWRRLFKGTPLPGDGEVVKTYPWVPILNQEPFDGQLSRIKKLLKDRPKPTAIFLNDLQGAPSACGCGHHLCRWTSDYGKLRATTPLGNQAPADFAAAVQKLAPQSEIIPVWTTECEEHDGAKNGLCAGVRCFRGKCWEAWTEQLAATATQCRTIGALLPYKEFQRNLTIYGPRAGWIAQALKSFQTMPERYQAPPIPATRLLAVLQGWNVTDHELAAQMTAAKAAGVQGILVAYDKIEQGWTPRIIKMQ